MNDLKYVPLAAVRNGDGMVDAFRLGQLLLTVLQPLEAGTLPSGAFAVFRSDSSDDGVIERLFSQ